MKIQELQSIKELYNLIHQWQEKYTVGWHDMSQQMRVFYRGVTHLTKSLQVLTDTEGLPLKTVEEKLADAVFYVLNGSTYKINFNMKEERWFDVSNIEEDNDTFIVRYDSIPANAYFLGTVRL